MTRSRVSRGDSALQLRYGVLHALWWALTCACCAFAAIFLGAKGMSSTEVGIVTGGASVCSIVFAPMLAAVLTRFRGLTIPRLLSGVLALSSLAYLAISFHPLPPLVVAALYLVVYAVLVACVPLLAQISMNYIRAGRALNFGLARGFGSVSYATSAALLSMLVARSDACVLSVVFLVCAGLFMLVVNTMPACGGASARGDATACSDSCGMIELIRRHPVLFGVLVGFMLEMVASTSLSIYLIDIVEHVGGNTDMYGVAVFCMAASELPAMAVVPRLRRRLSAGTLFAAAGVAYLLRNVTVALATSTAAVLVGLTFQSMSYGLLTSLLTYFIAEECGPRDEMTGQMLLAVMTTGIGATVGTVAGGALQDAWGIQAMLLFSVVATAAGSSLLIWLGLRDRAVHPAVRGVMLPQELSCARGGMLVHEPSCARANMLVQESPCPRQRALR